MLHISLIPPVLSHHRLKNELFYTFNQLVLSRDGLKNEIYYTHYLFNKS